MAKQWTRGLEPMATGANTIKVTPETAPAPLLERAASEPVILERDGELYRLAHLSPEQELWAGYDPEAALRGINDAAGSWSDIDADAFKDFIYRARQEGSRPADRP